MKKRIMRKWVRALRSGKYKQGQKLLKAKDDKGEFRHCCLGVLCELHAEETGRLKFVGNDVCRIGRGDAARDSVLHKTVQEWAGMGSPIGCIGSYWPKSLASMNDGGMKFAAIANAIEKNWEKL